MTHNFDERNIDEFDKFPTIRQYFPYQNFPFSYYLPLMNLWRSGSTQNKIIISEAPPRVASFFHCYCTKIAMVPNFLFTVENLIYCAFYPSLQT